MCTAVACWWQGLYFGRNMDIDRAFGEEVVAMPRAFPLQTKRLGTLRDHLALLGMAHVADGQPLYADAMNEAGLCMAALRFAGHASYLPPSAAPETALAPYELISYLLATCRTLAEARRKLAELDLVAEPFSPALPLAPLHWLLADATGSVVIERTKRGLRVYDNPFGVLANNPPFPYHCENVRQYCNLSPRWPENRLCPGVPLAPVGVGAGAVGLPGDSSSPARFVRAFYHKAAAPCPSRPEARIAQLFHILSSVEMVRGAAQTAAGAPSYTRYSCCMHAAARAYFYKTYENTRPTCVVLTATRCAGAALGRFALRTHPDVLVERDVATMEKT